MCRALLGSLEGTNAIAAHAGDKCEMSGRQARLKVGIEFRGVGRLLITRSSQDDPLNKSTSGVRTNCSVTLVMIVWV